MPVDQEKLDRLRLRTSAFKVLCYLAFKDGALKPSEIAEGISEKPSTVRARLTELKSSGLVESRPGGWVSNVRPYDILMKMYRELRA
jgi:predicted transcriptional regulator